MIDVELTINGRYFSPLLSTYCVTEEVKYREKVTTADGVEHYFGQTRRDILEFKLLPHTDFSQDDFTALTGVPLMVTYDKGGEIITGEFALDCDLQSRFLLVSCDGLRRYKGDEIRLRAREATRVNA